MAEEFLTEYTLPDGINPENIGDHILGHDAHFHTTPDKRIIYEWEVSSFQVADRKKRVSAPAMLKAVIDRKFTAGKGAAVFNIKRTSGQTHDVTRSVLNSAADRRGWHFEGKQKRGPGNSSFNQFGGSKKGKSGSGNGPPTDSKPVPTRTATLAPATAKLLHEVPEGGCEFPVGEGGDGKPRYCAQPGKPRFTRGRGGKYICNLHNDC